MDRRSWPWKKKSSDKAGVGKAVPTSDSLDALVGSLGDQDTYKKLNYVQISVDSYSHLTGLEYQVKTYEDQVKTLDDQVKELTEKLSAAQAEMTDSDNLVKQHAKVAEEAVSGWEKAEAEALALKDHLESVTLLKLTAEDRASHLDNALKECMKQIQNLKEEHEQKLHEVVLTKTKQLDKIKFELEAKISNLDHELLKSEAENVALSRSLQERSNILVKISEEKSQAEAEVELLKSNIVSSEREINSLKYELHMVAKELEIRNEEKNMSVRSADVANKQHLEGAKKIAKLEAECQRLRVLVRKKLPGPAALAQMKLEVESLGRDYGETRVRRSPVKPPSPRHTHLTDFSFDAVQKFHKEYEFLTERLLAMEEETKMLKEALAMRNNELQASRNIYAKTFSKLQSLESQLQVSNQPKSPSKSNLQIPNEGYSFRQNASSPPSFTSMSEYGNDDEGNCAGSWATTLISELSQFKKEKNVEKSNPAENANQLELMDDFLEMEKFAYLSNESNGAISGSDVSNNTRSVVANHDTSVEVTTDTQIEVSSNMELSVPDPQSDMEISLSKDSKVGEERVNKITEELAAAISLIHDFVLVLGNEAMAVHGSSLDGDELSQKIQEFVASFDTVINSKINLLDFVLDLSRVLNESSKFHFKVPSYKNKEAETNSSDCIDKIALPNGCVHFSSSSSEPDIAHEGSLIPTSESTTAASWKCSHGEFEDLKLEKDNLVLDLARCSEDLEGTKNQLQETEEILAEVKSQLASAQKMNSLAETQLKCMAESYKSLETRAEELQIEVNVLRVKAECLDNELQEEKRNHLDALAKCKDLQDQLQRNESCAVMDHDAKANQETDLAAAAEKLAECQETIFLLGKQLNALRPQTEFMGSPHYETSRKGESFIEEPTTADTNLQDFDPTQVDATSFQKVGSESRVDPCNSPFSPIDTERNRLLSSPSSSRHPKQPSTMSGTSSSPSPTPEKHSRGFTRFFSSKGKNGY